MNTALVVRNSAVATSNVDLNNLYLQACFMMNSLFRGFINEKNIHDRYTDLLYIYIYIYIYIVSLYNGREYSFH